MTEDTQTSEVVESEQDGTSTMYWGEHPIRITNTMDGTPAFYAKDVLAAMNVTEEDYAAVIELRPEFDFAFPELGNLILEPGIYLLAFVSDLEENRQFVVWVAKSVLPEIRKFGSYVEREKVDVLEELRNEAVMQRELQETRYAEMSDHLEAVTKQLSDMATVIHTSSHPISDEAASSKRKRVYKERPYSDEQFATWKLLHEQAAQLVGSKRNAGGSFQANFTAMHYNLSDYDGLSGNVLNKVGTVKRDHGLEAGVDEYLDCCRNVLRSYGLEPVTPEVWEEGIALQERVESGEAPSEEMTAFITQNNLGKDNFRFTQLEDISLRDRA